MATILDMKCLIGNILLFTCLFRCYGQTSIDDYLLNALGKSKREIETLYSDSTNTNYYRHSETERIDSYDFTLKQYRIKTYRDTFCQMVFKKNKLQQIVIKIFFDAKDSLSCKSAFDKILKESNLIEMYPVVYTGSSTNLVEVSYGVSLELKSPTVTPYYQFYKTKAKKRSVSLGYSFSNISDEFVLSIVYLNTTNI